MFVFLFRYVFGGAIDVGGESYVNFLMAGSFVQTVAFGSLTTGVGPAEDLQKGLVDRFRSLPWPAPRSSPNVPLVMLVVGLLVGLLVGFRPDAGPGGWAAAMGLLLLLSFAFSFPLTFASSASVQTDGMPGWLQAFADRQPITQVVDAVRGFLLDQPVGSHGWQAFAWCLGILLVFVPLSVSLYRRVAAR